MFVVSPQRVRRLVANWIAACFGVLAMSKFSLLNNDTTTDSSGDCTDDSFFPLFPIFRYDYIYELEAGR